MKKKKKISRSSYGITGSDIVAAARSWLYTPFHHQGRLKGVGVDCLGVILGVAHELKITDFDVKGYGRIPSGKQIEEGLALHCNRVHISEMRNGDIILFRFDKEPQHLAFKTDVGILHSYQSVGECVETSMDESWQRRLVSVWRFKGLD